MSFFGGGILLLGFGPQARAQDTPTSLTWERRFIDSNIAISEWFDGLVEGVDLFLVGKEISDRRNESSITVTNSTYSVEGEDVINKFSIGVSPKLPHLEEYWQVKFTSYDEREDSRGIQRGYLRQQPQEERYGATLGLFQKVGDLRASFQPRIELTDPLQVSHSLSLATIVQFARFSLNPKVELFAKPDLGVGFFGALNAQTDLSKKFSLTFVNEGEYQEKIHKLSVTNGLVLGQMITDETALSYSAMVISHNREVYHVNHYSLAVSWNQLIYRRVLDYQVTPHIDFYDLHDFKPTAGLAVQVRLHF